MNEFDDVKSLAQDLQRFIIEDDYKITSIAKKIISNERIVLDIGMEDEMPEFIEFSEELDEQEVEYELYKWVNGEWSESEIDDLELSRIPEWITALIGLNIIWYGVMTILQFFFIYDWYSEKYEMGFLANLLSSFFTALVPIYGSLVAYWSVTELGDWESYKAFWAFFVYYVPLLGFILYLIWMIIKAFYADRWYRFWHSEFN
ncbi:MAG: Unknown protein [uncultured Sulfurovum sp.]|uniref:Uncharacterized protein n=1 Tax=uncultured Sulfurovum sp. TaxID=269237 RepID=A0A6S6TKB3_9BACT|nr:MAG: Unknown protein [uncultured Sulfurovum sp.]